MAVTFQQVASADAVGASRTVTFTLGAAPLEDDVIYLFLACNVAGGDVTDVSGWTNILGANTIVASDAHSVSCFYHKVTAGEAGSSQVTWTLTDLYNSAFNHSTVAAVYRGVDPADPLDDFGSAFDSADVATIDVPVLTPTVTGGVLLAFVANDGFTGPFTTPTGWTVRGGNPTSWETNLFEYDTLTTATVNTPGTTITNTGTTDEKCIVSLIVPAEAGAGPTSKAGWGIVA